MHLMIFTHIQEYILSQISNQSATHGKYYSWVVILAEHVHGKPCGVNSLTVDCVKIWPKVSSLQLGQLFFAKIG